jgi:phospholipase/carboxylesterase
MTGPGRDMPDLGFAHVLERGDGPDTLLVLHATGGDETQLLPLARQLAPRAHLLAPRGKVLEGGTVRRFFARRSMLDLDIDDLMHASDELAAFVAAAVREYGLDPARVTALGYSNGANAAVGMLFRHAGTLRGAALLRPVMPYEPGEIAPLDGCGVLIAAGTHDPYSPATATARLGDVLAGAGADVRMSVAEAGHELVEQDLTDAADWLAGTAGG